MNVVILNGRSDGGGAWHADALARAFEERGHRARVLPFDALAGDVGGSPGRARVRAAGQALDGADAVLARIVPRGSLEQVVFRLDVLHRLEARGIPVVNPARALERTVDKFYASFLFEDAGLPTPPTVVAERERDALAAFRAWGDVIVKPLFGANGRGMVRIDDEEVARRVFRALELERAVYYVQRTVPHEGRDLRAFVVGDRVVAAVWRCARSAPGTPGWRTNLARGAHALAAEPTPDQERLALSAARAVGAEIAGVDLLPAPDGSLLVLEVNGVPGWKGLQQATGVDVPGAIVDHLKRRVGA